MKSGFVLLPRVEEDLFGNPDDEPLCRRGAWHWLFEKASWRSGERWNGKTKIELERGQLCCSYRYLARAWGWTHGRVQRWLELLVQRGKIVAKRVEGRLVVTLLGYDRAPTTDRQPATDRPPSEPPRPAQNKAEPGGAVRAASQDASQESSQRRSKESKEPINQENPLKAPQGGPDPLEGFEDWWKGYPSKVGKGAAERAWRKARHLANVEELTEGVQRYIANKPEYADWAHPGSWLSKKRWLDEYSPPAAGGHSSGPTPGFLGVVKPEHIEWMRQMDERDAERVRPH